MTIEFKCPKCGKSFIAIDDDFEPIFGPAQITTGFIHNSSYDMYSCKNDNFCITGSQIFKAIRDKEYK